MSHEIHVGKSVIGDAQEYLFGAPPIRAGNTITRLAGAITNRYGNDVTVVNSGTAHYHTLGAGEFEHLQRRLGRQV